MTRHNPYRQGLDKNAANYVPLSPMSFLRRSAEVYPERIAIIHGDERRTWAETEARCRRLASALSKIDIGVGDTVATLLPNTPAMVEAHFGVPMSGAVLNTINIRLNAAEIAFILGHGGARVLLVDPEFRDVAAAALDKMDGEKPQVIDVADAAFPDAKPLGATGYEAFLEGGDPAFAWQLPEDEWDAIALGYTSGTTGNPKGVVTHHRGAYLNAVSNVLAWGVPQFASYLWTLPLFHCNGWCFPWTIAAVSGTNVCLRRVEAKAIWSAIRDHRVTHYCGAPIVHSTIADVPDAMREGVDWRVNALVAGAAPPSAMIAAMERIGFDLTHVYGLTETYGPAAVCAKHPEWEELSLDDRVAKNGRQGVPYPLEEAVTVLNPETMEAVPRDGTTVGEIMFRGNIVMKGYFKNPDATAEAFEGGWFHSGDLAVLQPDGYLKIQDRSKDVIISGGENVSSLEVEDVLQNHPGVKAAVVIAMADEKWGEVPAAFVETRDGESPSEDELIAHCKAHLAKYKAPKKIIFEPLARTSTGKIQKFVMRKRLQEILDGG
jgi:fatty-acyl-CoA synthase